MKATTSEMIYFVKCLRGGQFPPSYFTEKDIEMLQQIIDLLEQFEAVSVVEG